MAAKKTTKKKTTKRPSLRKAVNDTCKMCIYDSKAEGTWLKQVTECTAEGTCPLYAVRPTTK